MSTLDYMGNRLERVTGMIKDVDEFQQAVAHVNDQASKRMPDMDAEAKTPARTRTGSGPLSALTPMYKFKAPKALDMPSALQDALRHAGIAFNQDSIEVLQDVLIKTQMEREKKLQNHYTLSSASTHEQVAERCSKADGDLRVMRDVLYKHTPFQRVNLTDPKLEEQLKEMELELEEREGELMEAEASELSLNDPKVRAFVAKYGS